jgi:hypothetical protein
MKRWRIFSDRPFRSFGVCQCDTIAEAWALCRALKLPAVVIVRAYNGASVTLHLPVTPPRHPLTAPRRATR